MARNEEKQYGRLNRLWLQKAKEEGCIKDVPVRPKLSTLNSAAAVKKWMPTIKDEIEYYLQQSQLSHYPERKIAEFSQRIEELEREYKRFFIKMRSFDPSQKHHPWTPRAYTKRRQDQPSALGGKRLCKLDDSVLPNQPTVTPSHPAGSTNQLVATQDEEGHSSRVQQSSEVLVDRQLDQDQPLAFDRTRLAVAAAACRGSHVGLPRQTDNLSEVLFSGLPNLRSSPLAQGSTQLPAKSSREVEKCQAGSVTDHDTKPDPGSAPQSSVNLLGLACYSSSDEDS